MGRRLARGFLIIALCVVPITMVGVNFALGGGGNPGTGVTKYSGPGLVGDLVIVPGDGAGISFTFTSQCRGEPFTATGEDEPDFVDIQTEDDLNGYVFYGGLSGWPLECTPAKASSYDPFINNVISFTKLNTENKIIATVVVLFEVPAK